MPRLSDEERQEVIRCLAANQPLPDKYRFLLFDNRRDVELVWRGKTDAVCNAVTPFHAVERVAGSVGGWTNKLIRGDNQKILASLKSGPWREEIERQGGLKLIYIDPPFDVGDVFAMDIEIGDEAVSKKASVLEKLAYRDVWGKGGDSFLAMIYHRLLLMRDLLADDGSIYVHCDCRANSHIRLILDELFGVENHRNQIRWCYRGGGVPKKDFAPKHDTIFRYSKTDRCTFNVDAVRIPYSDDVLRSDRSRYDKSYRGETVYEGYVPNEKGKHPEDWWTIQPLMPSDKTERVGYPTQKPVELLQRIVDASTNPGDLVADFFCGSGTTLAVAEGLRVRRKKLADGKEKLEYYFTEPRKWIGSDLSGLAVHVARKRILGIRPQLLAESREYRTFEILAIDKPDDNHLNSEAIELQTHVRQDALAIELTGFSISYSPDSIARAEATLKKKDGKIVVEQGQLVRLSKDQNGKPIRMPLTRHWSDWIDYWSVDFHFENHRRLERVQNEQTGAWEDRWTGAYVFENAWQSFRTKKSRTIALMSDFHACGPGPRKIAVQVVDIFGNTAMTVVEVAMPVAPA